MKETVLDLGSTSVMFSNISWLLKRFDSASKLFS